MSKHDNAESNLDRWLAGHLEKQSNKLSRRSALMRVGQLLLRLSGLTLIPLLPVDRRFKASAQTGCSWQTCGMCGYLCNTCCNNSGGYSKCPTCAGMVKANAWTGCCYPSVCQPGTVFTYADCCSSNQTSATSCRGTPCQAACYPGFPAYCTSGAQYYACTIVTQGQSC